jgi:hypothetical protein
MGAVARQSLKDLQKILKSDDRKFNRLGHNISPGVINGPLEVWRRDTRRRHVLAAEQLEVIQNEIEILEESEKKGNEGEEGKELEKNGRMERDPRREKEGES